MGVKFLYKVSALSSADLFDILAANDIGFSSISAESRRPENNLFADSFGVGFEEFFAAEVVVLFAVIDIRAADAERTDVVIPLVKRTCYNRCNTGCADSPEVVAAENFPVVKRGYAVLGIVASLLQKTARMPKLGDKSFTALAAA